MLLEAINDFNSNDSRLWRARIGAFDVEQSDTLKLVLSNTIDFNISVMEESRHVPTCPNSLKTAIVLIGFG